MRRARRRSRLAASGVGRLQRSDPQRVGGHEKLRRPLGRRHHGRTLSEGVRRLSLLGASGHCRHGVRGTRDGARGARRDWCRRASDRGVFGIAGVALALLLAACDGTPKSVVRANANARPDEVSFTPIDSPSLAFLPRQQEALGWRLEEDPIVIPGNRLAGSVDNTWAQVCNYDTLDCIAWK